MSNSKRNKILNKTMATIIMFVMVFYSVPINIFAEEIVEILSDQPRTINEEKASDISLLNIEEEEETVVIGEIEEERTLTQKHFLMSDGTMLASIFSSNIHYEKDGKMLDINNTLEEVIDTKESLKRVEKNQTEKQEDMAELVAQDDAMIQNLEIRDAVIEEENTESSILQEEREIELANIREQTADKTQDARIEAESKRETKVYTNITGNAKISFTNKTSGFNLGSMESKGYTITWGLLNSRASDVNVRTSEANKIEGRKASEIEINIPQTTIEYADILENINVEYSIEPEYVKEDVILKNKEAVNNELKFIYDVGILKMQLLENNNILVYDEKEDVVIFTIQAPFMYDRNLEFSGDIELKLEEQEAGIYILTLIPDRVWLEVEDRVYPVTVDPSIHTSLYYQDIQDTYIHPGDQNYPNRGGAQVMRVGNGWENPCRPLIKFTLPQLNSGDQVINAQLSLVNYLNMDGFTMPTDERIINAHKITADWGEHTATWNAMQYNYDTRVVDYNRYKFNGQAQVHVWDITSIAKDWYTTGNNYGVMLKEPVEQTSGSSVKHPVYFSSDTHVSWITYRPMVYITYRNQTGLLDYMSYHSVDVGRAGTVHTNDYNGNVTLIHPTASTPGSRLPVTVSHVYNSNDKDVGIGYGAGFRLNLSQTLEKISIVNSQYTNYIRYIDEDGTRHYFYQSNGKWVDEDNLGLTITDYGNYMTMEDKGGNKYVFAQYITGTYFLWKIEDSDYNTIIINRSPSNYNLITSVIDGVGDTLLFNYSQWGSLVSIQNVDGTYINFNYANAVLARITYPDGQKSEYDYNNYSTNSLLTTVNNCGKGAIGLEYNAEKTSRVKRILEYSSQWELGNTLSMIYGHNLTKFTDNQGYTNNVNFNNWGQAIGVVDLGKTGNSIVGAYGKNYEYGADGGTKNRLTLESKLVQTPANMLYNGGAEYNGHWNLFNWNVNTATGQYATDDKYSGNRSFKLTSNYTQQIGIVYQQMTNVAKGKTYTLSTQAKNLNMGNGQWGGYIELSYMNANGTMEYSAYMIDKTLTGWNNHSVSVNYPSNALSPLYAAIGLVDNSGTIYFDNVQLVEGTLVAPYNLIENSGFEDRSDAWKSWNALNITYGPDTAAIAGDGVNRLLKLSGDANKNKAIYQDVVISGNQGDIFTYSAWIKVRAVPSRTGVCTTMPVNVISTTNQDGWIGKGINTDTEEWQYVSYQFVAPHDYNKIQVFICYYQNANEMYIDNVSLIRDESGNSFSYDSKGNLISTQDLAKQNSAFQYDGNNNLTSITNPRGGSFTYTYDTVYKHRLLKATSSLGLNYNFGYNGYGQNTSIKTTGTGSEYIESKSTYSANGKYLETLEDQRGNITTYTTNNSTGTISKVTDARQIDTNYTYDTMDRLTNVNRTDGTNTYQNSYTYSNDKLNTITHNGTTYSFVYDNFGNTKQVKVGTQSLITNSYAANNGNLTSSVYGNNQTISYTYDRFQRMLTKVKAQGTYQYGYDARSNLAYTKSPEGIENYFTYDLADRLIKVNDTFYGFIKSYTYDQNSLVNTAKYTFGTQSNTTMYNFSKENRISNISIGTNRNIQLNYDGLSRPTSRVLTSGANTYTTAYIYKNTSTVNKTTTIIESITNGNQQLNYTYDVLGNIETISLGNVLKQKYYYDELSQLIREDNVDLNKTFAYFYDLRRKHHN